MIMHYSANVTYVSVVRNVVNNRVGGGEWNDYAYLGQSQLLLVIVDTFIIKQ